MPAPTRQLLRSPGLFARASLLTILSLFLVFAPEANARAGEEQLAARPANQPSLKPKVFYLEDRSNILGINEAAAGDRAGAFRPAPSGKEINFGYSASAYWLRFRLSPEDIGPGLHLLEVAFPSLDRLEFYHLRDGAWKVTKAGDLAPFGDRPYPHRNFVFPLTLKSGQESFFYLRINSAGSLTVPLRLWQPEAFARHNQQSYAALALYYGILLALLAYNLLLFCSIRDRNYLSYVLFVAGMAVGQLSYNGLGNQFLWPNLPVWGNVAFPVGFSLCGLFGALFTRGFLETREKTPLLDKAIIALALGFALAAATTVLVSYRGGSVLTSLTGAIFSLIAVLAGVRCHRRGQAGARYFLLAWSMLLIGVAVLALRNLGWLPTNFFTSFTMQIGSALEMLLLSFALADRINSLRREKELAQASALAAREEILLHLRDSEKRLEEKVHERTAELEAANRKLRVAASHDPLTGLANRLLLDDRIEHALAKARRNGRRMAIMLIDLDNFKQINDRHGHATGDELLRQVAARLHQAVRKADTVARIGGDEFAVVIEDLQSNAVVWQVAEKIVASLREPVTIEGQYLATAASLGIALFPGDGTGARDLLKGADDAAYAAKKQGGNRFCFKTLPA